MSEFERRLLLVLAIWLFLFGIWPIAHPDHGDGSNPMTMVDMVLHSLGAGYLLYCWLTKERTA